ncbi:hypothetical protein SLEP1_g21235 [Rubroshorea leprosula]|uniref:Protein kinase domain-containing protein n=1 Tax=Rubroshorea leprosula TaxID=152421 RepID=A0AAV5JFU8_9ROSI|nr:hypothetical protein SLEP1_g21235 [Rubroshorea leprosula]
MAVGFLLRPWTIILSWFLFIPSSPFASSASDSDALLKLKQSFTNANALDSWKPGSDPCSKEGNWKGLVCNNGVAMGLRLEGMHLSGAIDVDALQEIKGLRSISLINNSFSGSIPEFNRLGSLRAMFLSGNKFSGNIASDYFVKMGALRKVWLSENEFTGNIPASLGQLSRLIELHLENNQFSGRIPNFNNQTLVTLNLANNKLEGEIPPSLSRFDANSFVGNPDLCGETLGVKCEKKGDKFGIIELDLRRNYYRKIMVAAIVTLGVMLLIVVIIYALRWRKKEKESLEVFRKDRQISMESIEVKVSVPKKKQEEELSKKRSGSSRKGSHNKGGGGMGELVMVNTEKGVFGLPDLMKAAAEVLGNGGLGSSYKAMMANGVAVAVKRMREMNAVGREEFDADLKRLGKLKHPNILTPLAYHFRRDEKLFVFEYLPKGSLLYLLHGDRGPSHSELDWPARLKIIKGIAKGLDYLYTELASLDVPHGNLKSSNVLFGSDNEPLLSEYGFCPFMNPDAQVLFAYKTPEAVQTGKVTPKSDVYCLGIVILEIITGKFPSQYLNNATGGTDVVQWVESAISEGTQAELFDPEIASSGISSGMEELLQIGAACCQSNPEQRLDMKEAIKRIEGIKME